MNRDAGTMWMLGVGATGAVMFVIVFSVLGISRVGYDAAREPVSALALGEHGWVQIVNFVATGVAIGVLAVGVRRAMPGAVVADLGCLLLGVFAVGLVASGLFVMDPPVDHASTAVGPTWHSRMHDVFGLVVFTALPAAAVVLALAFWGVAGLRWLSVLSVLAGAACAGLFVAFAAATESGAASAGAWQRASILVGWTWLAVVGVTLMAHETTRAAT